MKRCNLGLILPLLLPMSAVAVAQQGSATQGFVYNMKMGDAKSGSMDFSMAFTIKATAQDGTRNASLVVKSPKIPPLDGKKLDATISPAGAISIGSTGDITKHYSVLQSSCRGGRRDWPDAANAYQPHQRLCFGLLAYALAEIRNILACVFERKPGGRRLHHHRARASLPVAIRSFVTMKGASDSGPSVTGQGNYDPVAHLVVNLHSILRLTPQAAQGQEVDVAMANP